MPILNTSNEWEDNNMKMGLRDKHALVIGGSRGLGRAIALGLAQEGARVGVIARDPDNINKTIKSMGSEKKGHWGISKDLMPDDSTIELINTMSERNILDIDILIHNLGGTLQISDPFCGLADWRKVWRYNLEIAIDLNRHFVPIMKKKGWGRIIHISSIAATLNHGSLPYGTVKAALNAYVRNMGALLAPHGIVTTGIMPGAILSEGSYWEKMFRENPAMISEFLNNNIAIKRFATPEEISAFVVFLSSEKASFFCGNVLPIDGGSR
jgi:3-oxoacyl-[acyl-carrier protein] reductase